MMETISVIKRHFLDVGLIEGGFQFNVSYAGILALIIFLWISRSLWSSVFRRRS